MSKRKSANEPAGTVRRKRLAFGVPKNAATKAKIQRNSTESPLLLLPVEIRDRIWSMVLGGGLIHLRWRPAYYYDVDYSDEEFYIDSEDEEEMMGPRFCYSGEAKWIAKYCTMQVSEQNSNTMSPVKALTNTQDPTEITDVHPHHRCYPSRAPQPPALCQPFPFDVDDDDDIFPDDRCGGSGIKADKPYLPLLRTCRQIYLEASRTLWTTNTFSFNNPDTLKKFMKDRKTAQKQLLKKLHLDMKWHWQSQKHAWDKALTLTLIRSLKGLRTVDLYIEQCTFNQNTQFQSDPVFESEHLNDEYFEEITKLKMLPLENVTVTIANGTPINFAFGNPQWPLAGRIEWAERLKSQLLDPEGATRWEERQEQKKESVRQRKEQEARDRAASFCQMFSTEEECAEYFQKRQDDHDKRDGRVRKEKKVPGPCGCQHECLICLRKPGLPLAEKQEKARNCPRPGRCRNVKDEDVEEDENVEDAEDVEDDADMGDAEDVGDPEDVQEDADVGDTIEVGKMADVNDTTDVEM